LRRSIALARRSAGTWSDSSRLRPLNTVCGASLHGSRYFSLSSLPSMFWLAAWIMISRSWRTLGSFSVASFAFSSSRALAIAAR
jgi:hypothetical protein